MTSNFTVSAGDGNEAFGVSIDFLNGKYDLNNATIQELYIMEDIFSPFVTGKIIFMDALGIIEKGPITGNETITVQYTGTGEGHTLITRIFSVYKISEISSTSVADPNNTVLEMYFMDSFFMDMGIKQYSRSWKKEFGHNIIKHIVTKMAKIDEKYLNLTDINGDPVWEECNEEFENFYMPWWTCIDSIKWIMKRMSSKKMENSGYLFFANGFDADKPERDGMSTLNLMTIDTLLSAKEKMKVRPNDDSIYGFNVEDVGALENKILSFTMDSIDKNSLKGIAGSHYYGFDNKAKKAIDKPTSYKEMVTKHTILGESTLFMDISEENAGRYYTGEQDEAMVANIAYNDWVKRYIMQQYMVIVVAGHEKRYAGGLIELKFPNRGFCNPAANNSNTKSKFSGGDPANMTLSGGYLVKTLVHYFNPHDTVSYRQKMVLIKNGYAKANDILVPAEKKNLVEIGNIFRGKH